jgi:hypothetical protein
MYHINQAVIKSVLSSMPNEEFYAHARYIHSQMLSLPVGTNRQAMFSIFGSGVSISIGSVLVGSLGCWFLKY